MYWSDPYIASCRELPAPAIGRLETAVLRDGVVGEDAAVAPAADAEAVGIGDPEGYDIVDAGQEIDDLLASPVGEDGRLEGLVAAGAAAVVDVQDGIAVGGEGTGARNGNACSS